MKPTLCRDCKWCTLVESDAVDHAGNPTGAKVQNGYCHLNPPIMIGLTQTTFVPVSVDVTSPVTKNYWCSHGRPRKEGNSRVQRNR